MNETAHINWFTIIYTRSELASLAYSLYLCISLGFNAKIRKHNYCYYSEQSEVYTRNSSEIVWLHTRPENITLLYQSTTGYLTYSSHFLIRWQSASKCAMATRQQFLSNRSSPIQICCVYFKIILSFVIGVTTLLLSLLTGNSVGYSQTESY